MDPLVVSSLDAKKQKNTLPENPYKFIVKTHFPATGSLAAASIFDLTANLDLGYSRRSKGTAFRDSFISSLPSVAVIGSVKVFLNVVQDSKRGH